MVLLADGDDDDGDVELRMTLLYWLILVVVVVVEVVVKHFFCARKFQASPGHAVVAEITRRSLCCGCGSGF